VLVPLGVLATAGIFLAWRYRQRKKRGDILTRPVEIDGAAAEPPKIHEVVHELPAGLTPESMDDLRSLQQTPTEYLRACDKHPVLR
jgi:hypothetical protein